VIRRLLMGQKGGVTLIMVVGFLALGVPAITTALNLSFTLTADSKVKNRILKDQYCALGTGEYVRYLTMDADRWDSWFAANPDPNFPTGEAAKETITICGKSITLTASTDSGDTSDPSQGEVTIPPLAAYNNRKLQTKKTVDLASVSPGQLVTYTITVLNRDIDPINEVNSIRDDLPVGFCYQAGSTNATVTSGTTTTGITLGDPSISTSSGPSTCPDPAIQQELTWNPSNVTLQSEDYLTITFSANATTLTGSYCNEVQVVPGGDHTRSGKTAIVQVGGSSSQCPDSAVAMSKSVTSISNLSVGSVNSSGQQTFDFTTTYTVTIQNIGTDQLTVKEIEDLLPEGFTYVAGTTSGAASFNPKEHWENTANRYSLTWDFKPDLAIPSGGTETVTFNATASVARGDYWSDTLVQLGGSGFSVPMYTWPTAVVTVRDAYNLTATSSDGQTTFIKIRVIIGSENGAVLQWDIS